MGFGGISIGSLVLILLIVLLLFSTKRLRTIGRDLGTSIRGFNEDLKGPDQKDALQEQKEEVRND